MCLERFKTISNALKIEAAIAAHRGDFPEVLAKRREAASLSNAILHLEEDPQKKRDRQQHHNYLEYWRFVTEGYVALLNGDFTQSKEWFSRAVTAAKRPPLTSIRQRKSKCFPNYFRSISEIQAHELYIDGIEKVRLGRFAEAHQLFEKWLNYNIDRRGKYDFRFDNILLIDMISDIVSRLCQHAVTAADWQQLYRVAERLYVGKAAAALLHRLMWTRELLFRVDKRDESDPETALRLEVGRLADQWRLFVTDDQLLVEDKRTTQAFETRLPIFIDIFDVIDPAKPGWQDLLLQNLQNYLLMRADYEYRKYLTAVSAGEQAVCSDGPQKPSEDMTVTQLAKTVSRYLHLRSEKRGRIFDVAWDQCYPLLGTAVESGSFHETVDHERDLLSRAGSWPHVICVTRQKKLDAPIFVDEDNPRFLATETDCLRLWRSPAARTITFEGPQNLQCGAYYYLRSDWNRRMYSRYRIRHEHFWQSDVPRWMDVFHQNLLGKGKVGADEFRDWILQFDASSRLRACRLLDALVVYDIDTMRDEWARIYKTQVPLAFKTGRVACVGTGYPAKSGHLCTYFLNQGLARLDQTDAPIGPVEMFRSLADYVARDLPRPERVLFLDDFVGTGGQAVDFLKWYYSEEAYSWIKDIPVCYCVLCGFESALNMVRDHFADNGVQVIAGRVLRAKDRAFSPESPIWESEEERALAQRWAEDIGRDIVPQEHPYDPERDKLGWHGCQALVVFPHNPPSDTLPIFWGTGTRRGRKWKPLFGRFDRNTGAQNHLPE